MAKTRKYKKLPDDFEGDFEALMSGDWERYMAEAKKLSALGIERVGVIGAVCPTCYRQCRHETWGIYDPDHWCFCPETPIVPAEEVVAAHGFPNARTTSVKTNSRAVV